VFALGYANDGALELDSAVLRSSSVEFPPRSSRDGGRPETATRLSPSLSESRGPESLESLACYRRGPDCLGGSLFTTPFTSEGWVVGWVRCGRGLGG
jgi:hypothetical protein